MKRVLVILYALVALGVFASCIAPHQTMASGRKLFTNKSPYDIVVTLIIRKAEDPRQNAGTKEFALPGNGSTWVEYGNDIDIYLNGIKIAAMFNGNILGQEYIVVTRGSSLDNLLERMNGVEISFNSNRFFLVTRQVQ